MFLAFTKTWDRLMTAAQLEQVAAILHALTMAVTDRENECLHAVNKCQVYIQYCDAHEFELVGSWDCSPGTSSKEKKRKEVKETLDRFNIFDENGPGSHTI